MLEQVATFEQRRFGSIEPEPQEIPDSDEKIDFLPPMNGVSSRNVTKTESKSRLPLLLVSLSQGRVYWLAQAQKPLHRRIVC